jgi:hypothetical protein
MRSSLNENQVFMHSKSWSSMYRSTKVFDNGIASVKFKLEIHCRQPLSSEKK